MNEGNGPDPNGVHLGDASNGAEPSVTHARRVEALTDFTRSDGIAGADGGWRYHFKNDASLNGHDPAVVDKGDGYADEILANIGVPTERDTLLVHASVGSPVVAWIEVNALLGMRSGAVGSDIDTIDRLLQVCTDQATSLESTRAVRSVAVAITAEPHEAVRAVVVATEHQAAVRTREVDMARAHRARTGRCFSCDRLADTISASERLLFDGTCFGAIVRNPGQFAPTGGAWAVPWAHASTLAAITEIERRDLAHAIVATLPWVGAQLGTWRLWIHQACVGDDSGDVHLIGRWRPDWEIDDGAWPWPFPDQQS